MSGETLYERPKKNYVKTMRVHDYLYDSAFIVSGARDYARTAFKAAMGSAQLVIQPVFQTMFSDLRKYSRMKVVYHPNCRLPPHIDRSYGGYLQKVHSSHNIPTPHLTGRDRFKYAAMPLSELGQMRPHGKHQHSNKKKNHQNRFTQSKVLRPKTVLPVKSASPEFHPPTPTTFLPSGPKKPRNRGTQSLYRESSAQTKPWQPDGQAAEGCEDTPEVLYLSKLEWGPGCPYRTGDLPADFHTTEIINKMRHARKWNEIVEKSEFPRWMKNSNGIIEDVEMKDWIFREAEIDELQEIRLELLHRMQLEQRTKQTSRTSKKLAKMWAVKKDEMERKIDHIRRSRDRELRKLQALHLGGGRVGQVTSMRAARGGGGAAIAARDPASEMFAPLARHGYQARKRHAQIYYDPGLLSLEDHQQVSEPPEWLGTCGQDLRRSCSGHHLPRDPMQLCERETKWSEQFLKNLHDDLKKARLGAAHTASAGPLHVLKPRRVSVTPRPTTPEVDAVDNEEEECHQAALLLQKILRGRAVQTLMYEGRTKAAELTEELKTTHGLQNEDKQRIAREEAKAREHTAIRTEEDQKEDAITALVDELCGGAVSAALDFLEKELRRLKEERRQHAFILIALRDKSMREASEAGRRQKEEHRRREHDEMFKQVLGVAQETVDVYLQEAVQEGVALAAEEDAVKLARAQADRIDVSLRDNNSMSTAEQNEAVAELVQQFLLPAAQRSAARHRLASTQRAREVAARGEIFNLLDTAEVKKPFCIRCGVPLGELCRCRVCPLDPLPVQTTSRDDPRWKHTRGFPKPPEKTAGERYPPQHEMRCMLNVLVDEAVKEARERRYATESVTRDVSEAIREKMEVAIDALEIMEAVVDRATGVTVAPAKQADYHHFMRRVIGDALERTEPFEKSPCPLELPSEIRRRAEEKAAEENPTCRCETPPKEKVMFALVPENENSKLLPSDLRVLQEMRRCKCDTNPTPSPDFGDSSDYITDEGEIVTTSESPPVEEEEKPEKEED